MKSLLFAMLFFLTTLSSFGQIIFKKGYFIDNNNQRVECLIKNADWKDNPKDFEYKLTENGIVTIGNLENIREFGIIGESRFVKTNTNVDISSMEISNLSKQEEPEWEKRTLFLKVLVEGNACLYLWSSGTFVRYFYSTSDTSIEQLVYKEYYKNNEEIASNVQFHQQLWVNMRCAGTETKTIEGLSYKKSDLVNYFRHYNECTGSQVVEYGRKDKSKSSFHMRVTPGINYTTMTISSNLHDMLSVDFGSKATIRLGIDAEYILPFNKNKWGLVVEPTYQNFNATANTATMAATINYNTIEFPFGLRHYFFLKPDMKIFLDAFFIPAAIIDFNSTIQYDYNFATPWEIKNVSSFAFGGGFCYKRYSAEIRYYTNRDFLVQYSSMFTDNTRISAVFGFKVF